MIECEHGQDDSTHKKGRHRKKQLYNSILQQMEFYFSDSNLSKDRFLSQLIEENPCVDLAIFLKFNKLRKLTTNIEDIKKAISKSNLIELSEDGTTVCRKTPIKVKTNVDECTIYVEGLKADATHEWLSSVFAEFGNVVYVSIPKYKHNKLIKGFAFVEFEHEKEAQNAIEYFESIGCKMPSHLNPEELCSISTFEGENVDLKTEDGDSQASSDESKKRKRVSVDSQDKDTDHKKLKSDEEGNPQDTDDAETKKRKKHKKEHKKKNYIKEIGLQILPKKEWKKMRNHYLDLQRKKMKEFKNHINKMRFSQQNYNDRNKQANGGADGRDSAKMKTEDVATSKLEFTPNVIVKVKLSEPCSDVKKLKADIKSSAPGSVKFVDIPHVGSEDVYIRFADSTTAAEFIKHDGFGDKIVLQDEAEKEYWAKIQDDRQTKFEKTAKKQRGRDKLLKKAKQVVAKHMRFDEDSN